MLKSHKTGSPHCPKPTASSSLHFTEIHSAFFGWVWMVDANWCGEGRKPSVNPDPWNIPKAPQQSMQSSAGALRRQSHVNKQLNWLLLIAERHCADLKWPSACLIASYYTRGVIPHLGYINQGWKNKRWQWVTTTPGSMQAAVYTVWESDW